MTNELEFYKVFEIEPEEKTDCAYCQYFIEYNGEDACGRYMAGECEETEIIYPPITDTILLGLEEIIIKNTEGFELIFDNNNKYAYIAMLKLNVGFWRVHRSADTRQNALLELCTELQSQINIKTEIQQLFNQ